MRILILNNFYPPYKLGGQEHSCQDVANGLKERGHQVAILTSMTGMNNIPEETNGIYRSLYLEMDQEPWLHSLRFFTHRKTREKYNLRTLEKILNKFQPDVVFIWGMWNLHRSLPSYIESRFPGKVLYRFASYWPTLPSQHELYWRTPGRNWLSSVPKQVLGRIALALLAREPLPELKFVNAICVSKATRDILVEAGIPVQNARIIYTGLDIKHYVADDNQIRRRGIEHPDLKLLFAGRLTVEKGIETVIRAMASLYANQQLQNMHFSIAGTGSLDYEQHLRTLVTQNGITNQVSFLGYIPREEMPELLRKFDVLLVPSIWAEPFARIVLEGMISGLVVIATSIGGTCEIIIDGENGLLFAPDNADELSEKLTSLVSDQTQRERLALAAQQTVKEKYAKDRMLDEIEGYLIEINYQK